MPLGKLTRAPTLQLSLLFVFFSDPYVRVTLKRKNKSIATEQTRKKKKVCYGITAWSICFLPDVLSNNNNNNNLPLVFSLYCSDPFVWGRKWSQNS